jgi:hypothetical protein
MGSQCSAGGAHLLEVRALPAERLALAQCVVLAGNACHFLLLLLIIIIFLLLVIIFILLEFGVCAWLLIFLILRRVLQARQGREERRRQGWIAKQLKGCCATGA